MFSVSCSLDAFAVIGSKTLSVGKPAWLGQLVFLTKVKLSVTTSKPSWFLRQTKDC